MRLDNGRAFPTLDLPAVGAGGRVTLPDDLDREWAAVLFYRGHW